MKLRNSLPSKDRAAPVAEGGCTQRVGVGHSSPGTTCSPSQGAQTHNCTLSPSRLQSPVLLLFFSTKFNYPGGSVLSQSLFIGIPWRFFLGGTNSLPCIHRLRGFGVIWFPTVYTWAWHTQLKRRRVLAPVLFAAIPSHRRCAQLHFHEALAASGTLNHTEYFCFVLSVALHICKYPLTLTSAPSSLDNPVFNFLLNKMSVDDNPYSTDAIW